MKLHDATDKNGQPTNVSQQIRVMEHDISSLHADVMECGVTTFLQTVQANFNNKTYIYTGCAL